MPSVSKVLSAERDRQRKTIAAIADGSGLSVGRVHAVLSGTTPNPGIITVALILKSLGKNLSWLDRRMSSPAGSD